ncbi:hypothetical protein SGLAM104S_02954 [Streptomyces glaucescens]
MQVAEAQGHRQLHRHPVAVPDGVVPAGVRRGQGGLDDTGLGGELGDVPVEGLAGLVDELGGLARAASRAASAWPPIRLRGSERTCSSSLSMRESAKSTALR